MTLSEVARELSVSKRTLQRRLDECDVGFRELREAARLQEAFAAMLEHTEGWVDTVVSRLTEIVMAFPYLLFVIGLALILFELFTAGVGVAVGRAIRTSLVVVIVADFFLSFAIWGSTTTVRITG